MFFFSKFSEKGTEMELMFQVLFGLCGKLDYDGVAEDDDFGVEEGQMESLKDYK
jgi:hypothetical protein